MRSFDPRAYDAAALRDRAMEFDREVFKDRLRDLILEAFEAFRRRRDDPDALRRLERDPCSEPENLIV